jgi:hypothetical protein
MCRPGAVRAQGDPFDRIGQVRPVIEMAESRQAKAAAGEARERQPSSAEQEILRAIAGIEYGSVEVVIHDGRVVQIECREKIRLAGAEPAPKNPIRTIR